MSELWTVALILLKLSVGVTSERFCQVKILIYTYVCRIPSMWWYVLILATWNSSTVILSGGTFWNRIFSSYTCLWGVDFPVFLLTRWRYCIADMSHYKTGKVWVSEYLVGIVVNNFSISTLITFPCDEWSKHAESISTNGNQRKPMASNRCTISPSFGCWTTLP